MRSQWWFASEAFAQGGRSPLTGTTLAGGEDWRFREAQQLSIAVEGAWVKENMDGGLAGDNDLVVTTRHRLGAGPTLDKLHFYAQEVPARTWVGSFFHPLIHATTDFRPSETPELALEVAIWDEDSLSGEVSTGLEAAIAAGTHVAALAFPVFAPFAGLARELAAGVVELVAGWNDHDRILAGRIRLSADATPGQGWDLLQPGLLVCFAEEIDAEAEGLCLDQRRRVCARVDRTWTEWEGTSYLVLRVSRSALVAPDFLIDQEAARLLGELEQGKGHGRAGTLDALRDTLFASNLLGKLARHAQLAGRPALTQDEVRLVAELEADPAVRGLLGLSRGGPA